MWDFRYKFQNKLRAVWLDKSSHLIRKYYPAGSENACMDLLDINNFEKPLCSHDSFDGVISGVYGGYIYGSMDGINFYKISHELGILKVLSGVAEGALYDESYLLTIVNEPKGIKVFDLNRQQELWSLQLSQYESCKYWGVIESEFDFVVIINSSESRFSALSPLSGNTIWSLTFLEGFDYNSSTVVGDYLYLLYQQDRGETTYDGFNIHYRVLHVHDKNTGNLVKVYDDVPGYSGLNVHRPTGGLYIFGADVFYSIQPMVDDEFCSHPVLIEGVDSIFAAKVVGFNDTQIMLYAHRYYREDPEMHTYGIVHFDVITKRFVYGQALERIYGRNPKIEIQQGFMFVTDENSEMSIFKWETDV